MVKVFFSYATADSDKFSIPELAKLLEDKKDVEKVFYWQQHATGSIIDYMEEKVNLSDSCVFFYSAVAAVSRPVKMERDMAIHQGKHIIPVFTEIKDVPLILQIQTGIDATEKTTEKMINEIYRLLREEYNLQEKEEPASDRTTRSPIKVLSEDTNKQLMATIASLHQVYKKDYLFYKQIADKTSLTLEQIQEILEQMISDDKIKGRLDDSGTPQIEDDKLVLEKDWNVEAVQLTGVRTTLDNALKEWEKKHGELKELLAKSVINVNTIKIIGVGLKTLQSLTKERERITSKLSAREYITDVAEEIVEIKTEQEKLLKQARKAESSIQSIIARMKRELVEKEKQLRQGDMEILKELEEYLGEEK